jgi:hypothetical protein
MENLRQFNADQIGIVNTSAALAEELVSDFYKMSASQWLHRRYDVKTLVDLVPDEIVFGPFAQVIRYQGQRKESSLGSSAYDFYKICLQDHAILSAMEESFNLNLFAFSLYIVIHELIHIVRFSKFIQSFDASPQEMMAEERRVHEITREILSAIQISGLPDVLGFYDKWRIPFDDLRNS